MPMRGDKYEPHHPSDAEPWPWPVYVSLIAMAGIMLVALHGGDHLTVPWAWPWTLGAFIAAVVGERLVLRRRS